ncbi:uncharacterized protein FOMMEDRAFT_21264 [Fomitiporia mediterranea MF3/22]|uniref:uncharacterized protein n=1 Tax=Fomitiporia mediterranea (strain MF3/22) TaxID=694068 RepID=UPI0004407CD8|nr:uncharacterized protein FOMMEDRAFT_21264 [Fomitiporia mediterranea MF3/22]EJD00741.1 hypothetical protein FOMMEDRAFT_21264 [Fomitiporia mediterranea MF3/22]
MATAVASPEKDTDRRASKDLPHLSLSLESPPSSSPFPSPSSSFIPPPMPGAHEYANKLHIPAKKKQRESGDSNTSSVATAPTSAVASAPSATTTSTTNSPENGIAKPNRSSGCDKSLLSKHFDELAEPSGDLKDKSLAHRTSLNSSRRAPPSPSVSRRTSAAHTNNNSVSLSRAPSNANALAASAAKGKRRSRSVKIRDFAYPSSDVRHVGQGPDAPRPGRSRPASEYEDMIGAGGSRRNSGWGAFRWAGSKLWGFALGGGKQRGSTNEGADGGFMPTSSDFARNFDVSSPNDEYPTTGFQGLGQTDADSEEMSSEVDSEYAEGYPDQDAPLLPGLYRALYAFVPEGTAEMALGEDQVVRIVGRGGGVGWAVAEDEQGNHALVPESYLEIVKLDEPTGEDDREGIH